MTLVTGDLRLSDRSAFFSYVAELDKEGRKHGARRYHRALSQVEAELNRAFATLAAEGQNLVRQIEESRKAKAISERLNEEADGGDAREKAADDVFHPLFSARQEWMQAIEAIRGKWTQSVKAYRQRDDFALRRGRGRMVCVFGKVKAGKSSLGNYVAYGVSTPTSNIVADASPQPNFFYETCSGLNEKMTSEIMERQRHFGIGIAETTSSIQGFSLPGFTWVDTPGVDSVNAANGDLTYQYIDASDLIIFTLNSSSPERESDRAKIVSFLRRGKPLMVVITASDSVEEDESPKGEYIKVLVMKSDAVRQEQCTRMRAFIESALDPEEAGRYDFSVVSLSARYACEGEGTEEERWVESGMQGFFSNLATTFHAQGESVRERTALRDIKTCLEETLDSLASYEAPDAAFAKEIDSALTMLGKRCREAQAKASPVFMEFASNLAIIAAKHKTSSLLRQRLKTGFKDSLQEVATDLYHEIGCWHGRRPNFQFTLSSGIPDFKDTFVTTKRESKLGSNIGDAVGSVVGGFAGLVGGPLGAAAGSAAGSFAGGMTGSIFDGTTETQVKTGDNTSVVVANCKRQIGIWLDEAFSQMRTDLKIWLKTDTLSSLKLMQAEVSHLKNIVSSNLESLKKDFGHGNS
ncbi:dynamin family protein [Gluconacetobacter sp. Hr-1-5]|uniref:dynamin family protein n=1 Tax=Gluconacetobacter sp. Hr-1-5 TaxID=3395370 RepID=UPI003B529262